MKEFISRKPEGKEKYKNLFKIINNIWKENFHNVENLKNKINNVEKISTNVLLANIDWENCGDNKLKIFFNKIINELEDFKILELMIKSGMINEKQYDFIKFL